MKQFYILETTVLVMRMKKIKKASDVQMLFNFCDSTAGLEDIRPFGGQHTFRDEENPSLKSFSG